MRIQNVADDAFRRYGKVLEGYDFTELLKEMKHTPVPEDVTYVPSVEEMEALPVAKELQNKGYGGLPIEIGYCNGHNKKLNGLEYHRSSEINVAVTDLVLLIGHQQDVEKDFTYDTSKVEAFLVPAGTAIEVYATTLHYAPCHVNESGFQCVVVLPKGTNTELTFEKAAEIGTKKVIRDHSTLGIVVLTDGSVTGIDRKNYLSAEERVINELKSLNKPFAVVLNTLDPYSESTELLRSELEEKYDVPIVPLNVLAMDEEDIENVMETVLYDFPLNEIRINLPKWVEGLERNHWIKNNIIFTLKQSIAEIGKLRDVDSIVKGFSELEFLEDTEVENVELGEGVISIDLTAKQDLFYNVLEEKSGFKIDGDHQLLNLVTKLSRVKNEYDKIESA